MKTRQELRRICLDIAGKDRKDYWYWRGWEVAFDGKPPGSGAQVFNDPVLEEIFNMGMADAKGELELGAGIN